MEFKRAATIAIICCVISFVLYRNLRQATEAPSLSSSVNQGPTTQQKTPPKPLSPGNEAWKLNEAMDAHALHRGNAFVQYVMLQLARNEKQTSFVLDRFPELDPAARGRLESTRKCLYDLFSDTRTVQQNLQANLMLAKEKDNPSPSRNPVPLAKLQAPTIKSHPWASMLVGKTSKVSILSRCVPADFYLIEFSRLSKLLDAFAAGGPWVNYFFTQAHLDATSTETLQRLQTQLLLDNSPRQRSLYDSFAREVAITGSDPFIREGSDMTLLFHYENEGFLKGIEQAQERLGKDHPDVLASSGKILKIDYRSFTTPTRDISAYVATLHERKLHVRSNSLVGLRRVLEAIVGRTESGTSVDRLGDSLEFQYVRTLLPIGATEEDGLVYLSDPFLRRLLGPRAKITEARRLIGYNHLRMIGHAAQMYRSQFNKAPATLEDLEKNQCVPGSFNKDRLTCPFGGTYTLSEDGTYGISSRLGTANFMIPCCELPAHEASAEEADAYEQSRLEYERDWRTYFDPIAIRLQVSNQRLRVETLLLPLQGNSLYNLLSRLVGNAPRGLDALPVADRTLFSANFLFNRESYLASLSKPVRLQQARVVRAVDLIAAPASTLYPCHLPGILLEDPGNIAPLASPFESDAFQKLGFSQAKLETFLSKGIDNQVGLHLYDTELMFDVSPVKFISDLFSRMAEQPIDANSIDLHRGLKDFLVPSFFASSLVAPVYLAVPVRDADAVDDFFNHLDPVLTRLSTTKEDLPFGMTREYYELKTRRDMQARAFTMSLGPLRWRLCWARIGNGLYMTNQPYVLDDLLTVYQRRQNAGVQDMGPIGQVMLRMRPDRCKQALPGYKLSWADNNRESCQRNLSLLSAGARAFSTTAPVRLLALTEEDRQRLVRDFTAKMYGLDCECPDGGGYTLESDGKINTMHCKVHGSLNQPLQQSVAPAKSSSVEPLMRSFKDMHVTLLWTPEGLRAVLVIERK